MPNNKYKYYIVEQGKIVSDGFKKFEDAIPTFLAHLKVIKNLSFIAIVKFDESKNLKRIDEITYDKSSKYYIVTRFGSKNGIQSAPYTNEELLSKINGIISIYGGNHCEFMGIIKSTEKESKKLFDKIKSLN